MFINYEKHAAEALTEIKRKKLFREYPVISAMADKAPYGLNERSGKEVIIWGNNNYLGLSTHKKVIEAKINAVKAHGAGSGGTRNVLGTSKFTDQLEKRIAGWHNKEKALLHISALDANIGVLGALGKHFQNAVFLSDEFNHASIIDGIKASGATKYIFRHNDVAELEAKLKEIRGISDSRPIIIVIESVYSMSGGEAKLKEITELKQKYNALLYVDEVHAIGIRGIRGSGLAEEFNVVDDIDLICGTLGKAIGSQGGYVAGSNNMIEFLRHYSRNFIYTTALAPDIAAAAITAIDIIDSDEGKNLRKRLKEIVEYLKKQLKNNGIRYLESGSNIIPVIIGDEQKTSLIARDLLELGIAITPIFSPTVPVGTARIRISPTPCHTEKMAREFATTLSRLMKKYENVKAVANENESWNKQMKLI